MKLLKLMSNSVAHVAKGALIGALVVSAHAQMLDPSKLPAIRVGKTDISGARIDSLASQIVKAQQAQGKPVPASAMGQVKQMAIETLVSGELVRLEIGARGIKPKKADVDAAIANMKNQAGGEKNLNEYIKKMGLNQASFTKKIEEQLASEQILTQVVPVPKEPSDSDRVKFYNDNKSKFPINDTIAGYQIYLKSDANDNADSLEAKKDLLNGWAAMVRAKKADIRQLAAEYSDDPQAKKDGGVVEPAPIKSFGSQMEQIVKTLKVGEVSKAFNGKNGLTIFMLAEKNDGTFESNKYKIDMALRMQQEQDYAEKVKVFISGLAKKYNVQYLDARYKPTAQQGSAAPSLKSNLNIK